MREARTADQLKEEIEHALGRACFVEIQMDPILAWRVLIVSNYLAAHDLKERADKIAQELRGRYILKIRRPDAQGVMRDELKHPGAFVQIVGDGPANYRVEVRGGDAKAQAAAEGIFSRLKQMYEIE